MRAWNIMVAGPAGELIDLTVDERILHPNATADEKADYLCKELKPLLSRMISAIRPLDAMTKAEIRVREDGE